MTDAAVGVHPPVPRPSAIGLILMGVWVAIFLGLIVALVASVSGDRLDRYGSLHPERLRHDPQTGRDLARPRRVLSVPVAAGRLSRNPVIAALAYAYSYFFRGTPLIAQTFLIYYGAGQFAPELRAIGLWSFVPRRLCLRGARLLAQHRRLPGRDSRRGHPRGAGRAARGGADARPP